MTCFGSATIIALGAHDRLSTSLREQSRLCPVPTNQCAEGDEYHVLPWRKNRDGVFAMIEVRVEGSSVFTYGEYTAHSASPADYCQATYRFGYPIGTGIGMWSKFHQMECPLQSSIRLSERISRLKLASASGDASGSKKDYREHENRQTTKRQPGKFQLTQCGVRTPVRLSKIFRSIHSSSRIFDR
jgi:hypothetical protein